jgi:GAF domain-containing protein
MPQAGRSKFMIAPAMPDNEAHRVKTLNQLDIMLDGESNERFDRITRVLAALFGVPIAMVNMITPINQINKSCFGIEVGFKGERSTSFCGHTILSEEPLVIEDALNDKRFFDNPNVTGGLKIRAYAGVPLKALDGTHPGALCLIDTKPRQFTTAELALLKDLSAWAEIELNSSQLREALDEISATHQSLKDQLDETRRLNDLMIGRELKMAEMKKTVAELEARLK